jgi:flagellar protein FlbD
MVKLTHLDGKEFVLNADQILILEKTPDTVITLIAGGHLMVREPVAEVVARVVAYHRSVMQALVAAEP